MLHDITVGNSIVVTTPTDVEVANPRRIFPINSTTVYESTIERTDPTQLSTGIKRVSVCVVLAAHLCYDAVAAEPGPRGTY